MCCFQCSKGFHHSNRRPQRYWEGRNFRVWAAAGRGTAVFPDEIRKDVKHSKAGTVGMASLGPNLNASQFYVTTRDEIDFLDGQKTIFGEVAEGMDVVMKINDAFVDDSNRPYQDIRIRHTHVLFDPFDDPQGFPTPPPSPTATRPSEETVEQRIPAEEKIDLNDTRTDAEVEEAIKENEAKSRAVVLEMLGDIPDADIEPPKNVLFVCKLHPVTTDEDLELIFSRFGDIKSCEIIRDYKTGDSLQYAFIEFETEEECNEAYFKMNNVLIDDRRIKVDFSQSVSKLWNRFKFRPWEQRKDDADGSGREPPKRHQGRTASGPVELRLKPQHRGDRYGFVHSGGSGGGGGGGGGGPRPPNRSEGRPRRSRSRSPRRSQSRRHRSRSRSPRRSQSRRHRSRSRSPSRDQHRRSHRDRSPPRRHRSHHRSRSPRRRHR